jgi:TonB family protein
MGIKHAPLFLVLALPGLCQFLPDASTTITYASGAGVSDPVLIHTKAPIYSEDGRKANWQKVVKLSLVIGTDGKPDKINALTAVGLGLEEQAVEAVAQWRFNPGLKDGRPVPVSAVVEANFRTRGPRNAVLEYRTSPGASPPIASLGWSPIVGETCGKTIISLHVGPDGLASDVRVVRATSDLVAGAVIESAKHWRFKPARLDGVPVGADAELDFECDPWPEQP